MKTVLFVCMHNAGRSQMAGAFFNHLSTGKVKALSAGTAPADQSNPVVVQAMQEVGIDISQNQPKMLTPEMTTDTAKMITMGCGADAGGLCPAAIFPTEDWKLDDP
ncbi:arsenate reductase ArsC, partial [Chloroflexota bacterium]